MSWWMMALMAAGVWAAWLVFRTPTWRVLARQEQWRRESWQRMLREDEERLARLEREAERKINEKRESN